MRLLLTTAVAVAAIAGVLIPSAGADPSNAGGSSSINVVCGSGRTSIVMNGNGIFTPAHDAATTSMLIPVALDVTLTFSFTAGGPPSIDHAIVGKNAPTQDPVSCEIPPQTLFTTPYVSATIQGMITGFWTPR
jgi:hypothetical protein